ncbi:MAG: hypothetical protein AAF613_01025 [Pseudomonadota bacterium]
MTDNSMTEARIFELIEAYGSNTDTWPEDERDSAAALIEREPAVFAAALEAADLLDTALLSIPEPAVPGGLAEAILDQAPRPAPSGGGVLSKLRNALFPKGARVPGGAVLASLAIGTVGGYAYASNDIASETAIASDELDSAYGSVFSSSESAGWSDIEIDPETIYE